MKNDLAIAFFEKHVGDMDNATPVAISGWRMVEILWPLNDVFRPHLARIRSLKYKTRFEAKADRAIERFAQAPKAETWADLSPGVWRVLLERHTQLLAVGVFNEKYAGENNMVTVLPSGLPASAELPGIMLLLLHGMKLPWPPDDRSGYEFPDIPTPGSMTLH